MYNYKPTYDPTNTHLTSCTVPECATCASIKGENDTKRWALLDRFDPEQSPVGLFESRADLELFLVGIENKRDINEEMAGLSWDATAKILGYRIIEADDLFLACWAIQTLSETIEATLENPPAVYGLTNLLEALRVYITDHQSNELFTTLKEQHNA